MSQKIIMSDVSVNTGRLEGIWRGVVEDNAAPGDIGNGACRIRIFGVHSDLKEQTDEDGIPTDQLPWSLQVTGLGGAATSSVPRIGSYVFLFFEDGNPSQPRYFGIAPGTEKGNPRAAIPNETAFTPNGEVTPTAPEIVSNCSFIFKLNRTSSDDKGTKGTLQVVSNPKDGTPGKTVYQCVTLELPWLNNASGISCFPKGTYKCAFTASATGKPILTKTYIINGTPGRVGCRFHEGMWAGNKPKGYKANVEGCVLIGVNYRGDNIIPPGGAHPQIGINNGTARKALAAAAQEQPVTLQVTGVVG